MSTATATEEDANIGALIACILAAIAVAVGVFALTYNIVLAVIAYIVMACFSYALTWVIQ